MAPERRVKRLPSKRTPVPPPPTPGMTPTPPPLDGMLYVPLAVVQLLPPLHSGPPPDCTAVLGFTAPPFCWLDIGTPVHLHLARIPSLFSGPCCCPRTRNLEEPLAIRGWIVAERARTEWTVEYVVQNEEQDAPFQRVSILFGPLKGILPPPSASDAAARRFYMRAETCPNGDGRAGGTAGPLMWRDARGAPDARARDCDETSREHLPSARVQFWAGAGAPRTESGPMTMNLENVRTLGWNTAMPTKPYAMWETYGAMAISRTAPAVEDGTRHYGRPIIIRPSGRGEGRRG